MKLFKNVGIEDLESILTNGILPIDKLGKSNWESGNRADNATDVVYLFNPISELNSFPSYGIALLEVECDAVKNEIAENDRYYGVYEEYVTPEVASEQIKSIKVPNILYHRVKKLVSDAVFEKITFVEMNAEIYVNGEKQEGLEEKETWKRFSKTAIIEDCINYFRGVTKKRTMIDLWRIQYLGEATEIPEREKEIDYEDLQKEVLKNLEGEDIRKSSFFIKKGLEERGAENVSFSFERGYYTVAFRDCNYERMLLTVDRDTARFTVE